MTLKTEKRPQFFTHSKESHPKVLQKIQRDLIPLYAYFKSMNCDLKQVNFECKIKRSRHQLNFEKPSRNWSLYKTKSEEKSAHTFEKRTEISKETMDST